MHFVCHTFKCRWRATDGEWTFLPTDGSIGSRAFLGLPEMPIRTMQERVEAASRRQLEVSAEKWEEEIDPFCAGLGWDGQLGEERMMSWKRIEVLHRSEWVTI